MGTVYSPRLAMRSSTTRFFRLPVGQRVANPEMALPLFPVGVAALLTIVLGISASFAAPPPTVNGEVLPPLAGYPSSKKNPAAPCTCGDAKGMSGWCERHGIGYVGNVKLRSHLLYETMDAHGHVLDFSTFQCPECQKAIDSDGYCEEHRIGFVKKLTYFSRLTYELARGERRDPAKITCPVCRKNARDRGWCEAHQIGMVGDLAILGRDRYQHLSKQIEILELANKASERCEYCAVAIVTDSLCPYHRITYKDGHPVPAPPAPER